MSSPPDRVPRTSPLHAAHLAHGARLISFAGWSLPREFTSLLEEHRAVRSAAGLFDVSHMGEIELRGRGAREALDGLVTNDLSQLQDGRAQYNLLLNPEGGAVDDLVVHQISPERLFLCVNASNDEKDFAWIRDRLAGNRDVEVLHRSVEFAQIALQGPRAEEILAPLARPDVRPLPYYGFLEGAVAGVSALVARTGYTGEDGFELYVPAAEGVRVWEALLEAGGGRGLVPAGLGARDTLRLEMGYALYGHEIDASTNPLEAGLGWVVKLGKKDFVGREALLRVRSAGPRRRLIGLTLAPGRIPRQGDAVRVANASETGRVTSGSFSPTLERAIAIALVPAAAKEGPLQVEIRGGKLLQAAWGRLPFVPKHVKSSKAA